MIQKGLLRDAGRTPWCHTAGWTRIQSKYLYFCTSNAESVFVLFCTINVSKLMSCSLDVRRSTVIFLMWIITSSVMSSTCLLYTHTHTHTHTHCHIYIFIYIYIYIHTYMYTYTYTHTHTHKHTRIYMYACLHTYIRMYIHMCVSRRCTHEIQTNNLTKVFCGVRHRVTDHLDYSFRGFVQTCMKIQCFRDRLRLGVVKTHPDVNSWSSHSPSSVQLLLENSFHVSVTIDLENR